MRSSVKSRLLRNWIGQNGQQEYKVLERSLARFQQKDRYRIDVLKTSLLPWLRKDQPSLDSLSEASLKTGRLLIMQWWSTLLAVLPDALNTDRSHYFECIIALMTRKEFAEFDRVEDMVSKPTTPSTIRTFIDGSVTEHTSSTTSVSSSTTLGSGYPFTDSSAFWSSFHQYRKMLSQSLQYAIEQLNQKGVFSNVITFCAKVLALCFFKLPGVAFGLLHALPVSRSYISRMAKALDVSGESCVMPQILTFFPERLSSICFTGTGSWWREFEKQKRKIAIGEAVPPMEMFGNWVRRWQSDDSELFFAFYRHYHICLAQYLEGPLQRVQVGGSETSAVAPKVYAGAPGYLYLSAFFLTKIEGLVHREIHPVTTIVQFEQNATNGNGSSVAERDRAIASVTTGEFPGTAAPPAVKLSNSTDAGKDGNSGPTAGKPKVLEMASRRFVETIVAIMVDYGNIYGAMLDIWIKAVVTKTSVYDVESVFCLLDFLDMLIAELETRECIHLYDSDLLAVPNTAGSNIISVPIHVQFILSTLHLLLTASDHTVTLMRTISFIYQNFSLLTVARIGGGVGILPGWKSWTPHSSIASQQERQQSNGGMMASSTISNSEGSPKKKTEEPAPSSKNSSIELSLSLIVRNIFEVMESRVDMVKRQYAGELSDVTSTRISEKDTESSPPESTPSSPGFEHIPLTSTVDGSPVGPPVRRRSNSDGTIQDEESREKARTSYQQQAHQIYAAHQKLTSSDSNLKEKERAKKSLSRSSLIGRKFRRLSRSDHNAGTLSEASQRTSFQEGDAGLFDLTASNKRTSSGSVPTTAGNFFRWVFSGGNGPMNNKLPGSGSSPGIYNDAALSKNGALFLRSNHSVASQSSASSSMLANSHDQSSDMQRHKRGSHAYAGQQLASQLYYGLESRKYPEHLTIYAGRSIPEHTAVLNEYVDWLAQCHAYGIKSRPNYASNGGGSVQSLPGGVPGIGLGSNNAGGADEILGDFSVFSLSMGNVVDVSTVVGLPDEWISPGMAQMMMARFPGLVVEWPKFWNNSREASGPPPGPITTLPAMAVVNNPAFSLGKGNAGGVGGGASAGAGGPFGGVNLNGSTGNGPSSLRHQQQAQMHHQQQMQLWSRNAAAAAVAAMAASSTAYACAPDSQDTQGNVMSMNSIATIDNSTAIDPVRTLVEENRC
ncbi:hypothetical protein BGZ50_002018 [Haplosporangium sp. Z 11]|nr:hypothetical protein BGZ50_002018 [Haplosporangium sp. Z 11]